MFKQNTGAKFFGGLVSHVQKRFTHSYVLTALVVLDAVNIPAKSFIFHGEDEIEFLVTINFDVDSADVGSKWFNDTMFRRLIKLNKYSNKATSICSLSLSAFCRFKFLGKVTNIGIFNCFIIRVPNFMNINMQIRPPSHFFFGGGGGGEQLPERLHDDVI